MKMSSLDYVYGGLCYKSMLLLCGGCVMKVIEGFVCVCSGWKGLHSKKAGKSVTLQFRNKINILVFHFYPLLTAAASELLILWRGAKTYMCNASQVVDMSRMPLAIDAFFLANCFRSLCVTSFQRLEWSLAKRHKSYMSVKYLPFIKVTLKKRHWFNVG